MPETSYVIREASQADAQRIAPLLRKKDRQEVETGSGAGLKIGDKAGWFDKDNKVDPATGTVIKKN